MEGVLNELLKESAKFVTMVEISLNNDKNDNNNNDNANDNAFIFALFLSLSVCPFCLILYHYTRRDIRSTKDEPHQPVHSPTDKQQTD